MSALSQYAPTAKYIFGFKNHLGEFD
jgi:hypothetical protein